MKVRYKALWPLFLCGCLVFVFSSCGSKSRTETIAFATDNSSMSDSIKTIKNFMQQRELFVLTEFGSYNDRMEWLNDYMMSEVNKDAVVAPKKKATKHMCSIFFTTNQSGITYHCQNFDNPESGILIGSFSAPGKYKSIALTRMTDISYFTSSFNINDLTDIHKSFLRDFAFYPIDGINEHGFSVSIAGSYPHQVKDTQGRKGVYVTYLSRLMLDGCKNVDDALALAGKYYFFDHDGLVTTNHLLIADRSGNSAIIEYNKDGRLQYQVKKNDNNVVTNKDVIGIDPGQVNCVRYQTICKRLKEKPVTNYTDCMNVLGTVKNETLWSVVMDNKTNTGYIATHGKFDHFYKFVLK